MDTFLSFLNLFLTGFQTPTLGFLLGGMFIAAMGSRLTIPDQVYKFIVFVLLMKIGLKGGMEIRNANLAELLLPALFAVLIGVIIVYLGKFFLA
jgi:hypothetical protein